MLPKGTTEEGETLEQVALREVEEETGVRNVRTVADLGEERYTFFWRPDATMYDKSVRYFLLEWLGGEEPVPQTEEGFTAVEWVNVDEAVRRIRYKETREVLKRAKEALQDDAALGKRL
jgi:8-oxo-dGTP pyrophosphatase MutT (NUDIX family)